VAITSATGVQNGTLNAGDTIHFTVNMSEATTVNATGSKPQLALNIGGGTVYADYDSGSGSSALVFKYTIQPGQRDSDGISIDNGAQLNLNGGSLVDAAGNAAAPALPALPANAGYKVDAVVPAVTAVGITSSNAAEPGNLVTGETVHISVTMSEATTVDTTGGTPQLALNIGGASVQAVYESGSGSTALVFKYVIQPGQTDLDGIGIDANALSLNGATLTDAAGNMASLAAPGAADNVAYKVNAVTSPTVVSAAITSATGNQDGFLSAGDTVSVTVTTNRPAFVTGTPQLDLDIGGRIVHATYASGSGGTALVFSYTIEDGEQDADGIAIVGNSLALNGGTILTGTNGAIALGHSGAPDNAGYVVDAAAPAVSGVAIGSATGIQNGVLSAGDVVSVIVSMSEATTVSTAGGVPQLDLDIGGDIVHAAYDSGSGSNALVFKYTIQPGQTDANGIAVLGNSLALNGGTMRDLAGNAASLAHAAATDSPGYVVEAVAPTLTSSTPAANATAVSANGSLVLNFSEAMSIGSGNIVISDSDGSSITIAASDASQVSVNGSTVTIRPSAPLKVYTTYTVAVEAGAFADAAGNPYAGLAGQSFTTASSVMSLASVGSLGTGIQVAGFTVIGESASDMSGYSVAAAGDVNGDGLADLIIGAPNYDTGGVSDTGRAYVVFGTASTAPISLTNIAAGKGGFVINGGTVAGSASTTVGIQAGYSVSAAGDLNGDGLADLLVGTPQHVGSNPTNYGRGKVFIVYGKSDTATVQLTSLGSAGIAINGGGAAGANYGASVAAVGDVNGDGMVDVAFGAPHDAPYNRTDTGSVYAYVGGSTTANTMSLSSVSTSYQNYAGAVAGDLTGSSVAAAGDFNGDGLADMIFGAGKGADATAADAGISYLVFGRSSPWGANSGNNGTDLSSKTSTLFLTITGESALDNAGMSAVGVGDVNGDGLADLLIGAPGADAGAKTDAGRSYVVFGTTSTAAIKLSSVAAGTGGFVINGESAGDASGYKVAAAGDLNGDGLADMLISANKADTTGGADAGRTYVVYGTTSTAPIELSAIAAGRGGFVIDGAGASDQSGTSVVAGGDINGDGLGDLIVSATQADANGVADVGVTYVIFGSTGGAFQASTVDQAADGSHATITGSAASETLVGDAGANTLVGNGGADVIHAGAGNDTIVLNAGNVAALQATYGSGGNATQLARVDGGGGIDTLKLDGSGINLDLSAIHDVGLVGGINMSRLSSIEKIDLTGSGNNSLKLTMADVVDIAGFNSFNTSNSSGWTSTVLGAVEGRHQLLIDGDAGDSVAISGAGWTDAGTATYNGHTYEVYRNGAYTELLIDTSVTRTLV
jgi:methionine-rich copper-binding protein CopC